MSAKPTTSKPASETSAATDSVAPKTGARPTLHVGIDLGTSRTAIAASNGQRHQLFSCVGKPKDAVAEKLLGKRLLFGQEAINHRLAVEFFRPLEKGVIKPDGPNVEAVRALMEHTVSLVEAADDDVVYAVIGAPARATWESKKLIIDIAQELFDGVMITSEPFSVAYGLDILTDALIVDIGAGTIDLCRMHGTFPSEEDQVTIDKAGDFIDVALADSIRGQFPDAQFSMEMIKNIKEKHGFVVGSNEKVQVEFTVNGRPKMFDITANVKTSCAKMIPEMVEAIRQLVGSFDPEFQSRLRHNVVIGGGGSQLRGLRQMVEDGLAELGGGKVTLVEEPVYAGANGALKIARDMPSEYWERMGH